MTKSRRKPGRQTRHEQPMQCTAHWHMEQAVHQQLIAATQNQHKRGKKLRASLKYLDPTWQAPSPHKLSTCCLALQLCRCHWRFWLNCWHLLQSLQRVPRVTGGLHPCFAADQYPPHWGRGTQRPLHQPSTWGGGHPWPWVHVHASQHHHLEPASM